MQCTLCCSVMDGCKKYVVDKVMDWLLSNKVRLSKSELLYRIQSIGNWSEPTHYMIVTSQQQVRADQ